MLQVTIPEQHYRFFDESTEQFFYIDIKETTLQLEHSLLSLKKWEQKWHIRFIRKSHDEPLTKDQTLDYIRCMTLTKNVDDMIYSFIPKNVYSEIESYINDPMTATTFSKNQAEDPVEKAKASREGVSAELIYYWMFSLGIPIECEKWHLNSLITLIRVFNIKNGKPKKINKKQAALDRRRENERRKAMLHTSG